jgi:tetratricopeptide (TPR) repeat protein
MTAQLGAIRRLRFSPFQRVATESASIVVARIFMAGLIGLLLTSLATAQQQPSVDEAAAKGKPTPANKTIQQAIVDLGSPSYLIRETASRQLWNAGAEAQSALEKAMFESDDFEVVDRARQIVAMFHLGIYPDTPRETVVQITNFRSGSLLMKRNIAQQLLNAGKRDLVERLIEMEPSRQMRDQLSRVFSPTLGIDSSIPSTPGAATPADIGLAVRSRLAQRSFLSAERLLRNLTGDDGMMRDYAALLLSRGKLDAEITKVRAKVGGPGDQGAQRQLAWMLRAKGDLVGAVAAAKASKDDGLLGSLRAELGDWKELAKRDVILEANNSAEPSIQSRKLAREITFTYLAGEKVACNEAVARAVALVKQQSTADRRLLDALLLNDRFERVIEAAGPQKPAIVFDVLAAQGRLQDAFRSVKIDLPISAKFDWAAWLKNSDANAIPSPRSLAHNVLRVLLRTREDEAASQLIAAVLAEVKNQKKHGREQQWLEAELLIDIAAISATPETGDELAAKLLELKLPNPEQIVSSLYQRQSPIAVAVWGAIRKQLPTDDHAASLKRLRRLLSGKRDDKTDEELRVLVPRIDAEIAAGDPSSTIVDTVDMQSSKLLALAVLLRRHEQNNLAAKYFDRVTKPNTSSQVLVDLGYAFADAKQWADAIRAFDAAWAKDHRNASALYLLGWAHSQHGEKTEGRRKMEVALMIPLADGESRHALARTLARTHDDEEAARQRKLVLQLAAPHDSSIVQSLDEICDAAATSDNGKKPETPGLALLSQRLSVELVLTKGMFGVDTRFYMQWRAAAHRLAARELLRAGKTAAAIEEIHQAEAVSPEDVSIALDCDAELRKQGASAEADALYHRMSDRLQADCRDFPRYATCRNDLAWLAANLDRDLDMALVNAQKAVELAPQSAGILDTLAEVHFRRGNRAQAVQLARRCIELDGDGSVYKERLAHFEK